MKSIYKISLYAMLMIMISSYSASPQGLLKKAGQRLGREAGKLLDKSDNQQQGESQDTNMEQNQNTNTQDSQDNTQAGTYGSSGSQRKKMTPPDVNKSIADAETAFASKDFEDTRYNVQQALMGIELEIGYQLLESLPKNVDGLDFLADEDKVQSNGWGFQGFLVERIYQNDKDKSMDVSIINNAAMISGMNMVLSNPGYANSDNNQKSVKVGSYRGLLTAEENGSFTLGVPLGQSSLVNMTFTEYQDENEVIAAAQKLDLEGIKTTLGEQ